MMSDSSFPNRFHIKAQELHQAMEERVTALERAIQHRDTHIQELQQKLSDISRDFEYNLNLIRERDAELVRFELQLSSLQKDLKHSTAEAMDLRKTIAEGEVRVKTLQAELHDVAVQHQNELATWKQRLDTTRHQLEMQLRRKDDEIEATRKETETSYREAEDRYDQMRITLIHTLEQQYVVREMAWKKDEASLRGHVEHMQHRLKDREDEVVKLREQIVNMQIEKSREIEHLKSEYDEKFGEVTLQTSKDRNNLALKIRDLEIKFVSTNAEHSATVERLKQEIVTLKTALEESKMSLANAVESHRKQSEESQRWYEEQVKQRDVELQHLETQRASMTQEANVLRAQLGEMKWELVNAHEKCATLARQIETRCSDVQQGNQIVERTTKELQESHARLRQAEVTIESLRKEKESADSITARLKSEVEHLQKSLKFSEEMSRQQQTQSYARDDDFGRVRFDGGSELFDLSPKVAELEHKLASEIQAKEHLFRELQAARKEMEAYLATLPPVVPPPPDRSSAPPPSISHSTEKQLRKEIERLQGKVDVLEATALSAQHHQPSSLLSANASTVMNPNQLSDFIALKYKLTELTKQAQKYRGKYEKAMVELEATKSESEALRDKHHEAVQNIQRLEFEKEKLMDVSNMLRADLNRVMEMTSQNLMHSDIRKPQQTQQQQHQVDVTSSIIAETDKRMKEYESRQQQLEQSIASMMSSNAEVLKSHVEDQVQAILMQKRQVATTRPGKNTQSNVVNYHPQSQQTAGTSINNGGSGSTVHHGGIGVGVPRKPFVPVRNYNMPLSS